MPDEDNPRGAYKVVLVTSGTWGDLIPFWEIARALKTAGVEVVLISHCQYAANAYELGISFDTWDNPEQHRQFVFDGPLLDNPRYIKRFADRHIFPYVGAMCKIIESRVSGPGCVIVARHMSGLAASLVAERRSLRLVTVLPSVAHANNFRLWIELCKHVLATDINSARSNYGLNPVHDWARWALRSSLFIGCWPSWFATPTFDWPTPMKSVGFVSIDALETGPIDPELDAILGVVRKAVLVAGGTAVWAHASRFYECAIRACEQIGRPSIVVCPHSSLISPGLLNGTCFRSELPFCSVMPRVAAVIHHGGTGTMVRAIRAQTPQVVLPFGGDRNENADRIEALGVGLQVPLTDWDGPNIARKLKHVLADGTLSRTCEMIYRRVEQGKATCTETDLTELVLGS